MADRTDQEEWAGEGDPGDYKALPPPPWRGPVAISWPKVVFRFVVIAALACGIGYVIAYFQNSGALSALSAELTPTYTPAPTPQGRRDGKGGVVRQPGVYINKGGTYVSTDGQNMVPANGIAPANTSLPTFVKTPDKGYQRVK